MELRVLKYFLALAQEQNITRAAALLHLTQFTLSRQLMQLEKELGVQMFRRGRYKITLTEEGMLLRRRAQELVDLEEKTKKELHRAEQLRGEIAIGSGDLEGMELLSRWLADFRALHPQVTYQIFSGNSDHIKERIEQGILDLGLLLEPVEIDRYESVRLPVREEWGVLVQKESPLAQKQAIAPKDLLEVPLIVSHRQIIWKELERWFGRYARQVKIAASGNLPYNMSLLAKQGMGAFLTLKQHCSYEQLRFLPLSPPLFSSCVLVWKRAEPFPRPVSALIDYISDCIADTPQEHS
ncbi:MAG: LysR family transcriptional regulator [Pygmaiobacter massiliensis]|nr:LysR family transcriptional regulator [Pygmaiobacter massiliensis]